MKFVETMCGNWINVDEISYFIHRPEGKKERYYSYVVLKSGKEFDLLDFPDKYGTKEKEDIEFSCMEAIKFHMYAIHLLDGDYCTYRNDKLNDDVWTLFDAEIERPSNDT